MTHTCLCCCERETAIVGGRGSLYCGPCKPTLRDGVMRFDCACGRDRQANEERERLSFIRKGGSRKGGRYARA